MARIGTGNLNLGTWLDEENPGAGSQIDDNTGLNGNWIKIDKALGTEHNADGTHKGNSIIGSYLKQTGAGAVVDEVTLEFATNEMQLKNGGVSTAKIADGALTNIKLATDAVTTIKIQDSQVTAAKLATDAVETAKIKALNVTLAKLADDAYETFVFALVFTYDHTADNYRMGDKVITSSWGIPVPSSTNLAFYVCKADGTVSGANCDDQWDSGHNAGNDRISVGEDSGGTFHVVLRNGAEQDAFGNTRLSKDHTQDATLVVYISRRR